VLLRYYDEVGSKCKQRSNSRGRASTSFEISGPFSSAEVASMSLLALPTPSSVSFYNLQIGSVIFH